MREWEAGRYDLGDSFIYGGKGITSKENRNESRKLAVHTAKKHGRALLSSFVAMSMKLEHPVAALQNQGDYHYRIL